MCGLLRRMRSDVLTLLAVFTQINDVTSVCQQRFPINVKGNEINSEKFWCTQTAAWKFESRTDRTAHLRCNFTKYPYYWHKNAQALARESTQYSQMLYAQRARMSAGIRGKCAVD